MIGYARAIDFVQYLAKGFVIVRFNDQVVVSKVLARNPFSFNQTPVCVLHWDPTFELAETFRELCPIWVEIVDLLASFEVILALLSLSHQIETW